MRCVRSTTLLLLGSLVCASCGGDIAGGESQLSTLTADVKYAPLRMASNGSALFWIDAKTPSIEMLPTVGGSISTLTTEITASNFLSVDAEYVYFLSSGNIHRVPQNGGEAVAVKKDGKVKAATLRNSVLYWLRGLDEEEVWMMQMPNGEASRVGSIKESASYIAATASHLFVSTSQLSRIPLSGANAGISEKVDAGLCASLVADDTSAFCGLTRVNQDGSVTQLSDIFALNSALDSDSIYFANAKENNRLERIAKTGGASSVVSGDSVTAIAVDAKAVYWATSDGQVKRLLK